MLNRLTQCSLSEVVEGWYMLQRYFGLIGRTVRCPRCDGPVTFDLDRAEKGSHMELMLTDDSPRDRGRGLTADEAYSIVLENLCERCTAEGHGFIRGVKGSSSR